MATTPPAPAAKAAPAPVARVAPAARPAEGGNSYALSVFAILAVGAIVRVALPVSIGLLLGMLTAFAFQPYYERLCRRTQRPGLSALLCVAAASVALAAILGSIGYLLIGRGVTMAYALVQSLEPGRPARLFVDRVAIRLNRWHLPTSDLIERLRGAAAELTAQVARLAAMIAGVTFHGLLLFFFALLTIHFILRNWTKIVRKAELFSPLPPQHTRALLLEFTQEGRSILLGTVFTGLSQGVLAGLGYLMCGLPQPAFFGAATAMASLIPGVGTMLLWVPCGIYLILTGHTAGGICELLWGALVVVGASDYVLRPMMVGGHGKTPALFTFIALFGGIEAFGLIGLILGPVIMGLALALLRIYGQDRMDRRRSAPSPGGA
jgi:predicted PurR-regulated permease PerM